MKRIHIPHILLAMVTVAVILAASLVVDRAAAAEPYGGCDEAWQAPDSPGSDWCRDHGWTVTRKIVVGPRGWVRANRLPACTFEDGSRQRSACFWNADRRGNGTGSDYWLDRQDRVHLVKG